MKKILPLILTLIFIIPSFVSANIIDLELAEQKGLDVGRDDPNHEVNIRTDVQFDVMAGVFASGQGDYVALFEPTASQVVSMNKGYIVSSLGEESGEIPYTCYSSLKSYEAENKDVLKKFTKALYKASDILTIIRDVSTTDVESVRHGEWKLGGGIHYCSNCGEGALYRHIGSYNPDVYQKLSKYCPNCGAKMDKEN